MHDGVDLAMRAWAIVTIAACHSQTSPAPEPAAPPSAWATRCLAAVQAVRERLGADEPELRTAALEATGDRVTLYAGPPVWDIPEIYVSAEREPGHTPHEWQRFNEPLGGCNHIDWLRSTTDATAGFSLSCWDLDRAARIEPILTRGLELCFDAESWASWGRRNANRLASGVPASR